MGGSQAGNFLGDPGYLPPTPHQKKVFLHGPCEEGLSLMDTKGRGEYSSVVCRDTEVHLRSRGSRGNQQMINDKDHSHSI